MGQTELGFEEACTKIVELQNKINTLIKEETQNKVNFSELLKTKSCKVDMNRVESFLLYANSRGFFPCGGAFEKDAQYFYI